MLVSNIFSRKLFIIMLKIFLILDLTYNVFFFVFFYISLKTNDDSIKNYMSQNNDEIIKGFNTFLSRRVSLIKQNLFIMAKHSDIFRGKFNLTLDEKSSFYKSYDIESGKTIDDTCLIKGSNISQSSISEFFSSLNKSNPFYYYIENYYESNNVSDSEVMINNLIENEYFDKISYYEGGGEDEDKIAIEKYVAYVCYMKSIFKTMFIKEGLSQGKYLSLNNIFLFMGNYIFQYLANETSLESIKSLSIYSERVICQHQYKVDCITDFINKNKYYSKDENSTEEFVEFFHYFDNTFNLFSCINLDNFTLPTLTEAMQNNYICVENNINLLLKRQLNLKSITEGTMDKDFFDIVSLIIKDDKIIVIFSLEQNLDELYDIYEYYFSQYKKILADFIYDKSTNEVQLFHLIYYDLFKYKKNYVSEDRLSDLISEYNTIQQKIKNKIEYINELNNSTSLNNSNNTAQINNINIGVEQSFLLPNYNRIGVLDFSGGEILKNDFIYKISPIYDGSIRYDINTYIQINNNKKNILSYNIIIYKIPFSVWDRKLLYLMIFIIVKWQSLFLSIILFASTLSNICLTKYLDFIFQPIKLLYERLNMKIVFNKSTQKDSNDDLSKNNKINEENIFDNDGELNSHNPEMEQLIQLCKFLENIIRMKRLMLSNEQMEIDFELMNEMYNVLNNKMDMIKYAHFVSSFYFKKKKYLECNNSIKIIENILEIEKNRFKEENENTEIEAINVISNKSYVNEFHSSKEVFEGNSSISQTNYYELIIIREKLYFYLGICYFFEIKELKKKLKDLKKKYEDEQKHREHNSTRGKTFLQKRRNKILSSNNITINNNNNNNNPTNNNALENTNINTINNATSKEKNFDEIDNQIAKKSEIALKYFKLSLEINTKYCINKIKCIVTLLYIAKCQLCNPKKKAEPIDTMKNVIIKLYTLNQEFININKDTSLNPTIMLIINGALMEQILFLIVKINKQTNTQLVTKLLSEIMRLSYFKTDNIQSKACKNIYELINLYDAANMNTSMNNANPYHYDKKELFHKISFRLSPNIIKLQKENTNIYKNIYLLFSQNLAKSLPSYIELCEILSKCIKGYMSPNDKIQCARFDMKDYINDKMRKPSECNKELIMRVLTRENDQKVEDKFGMQNSIFEVIKKINYMKRNSVSTMNNYYRNKDIINDDNYIFQFILCKDYLFDSNENKKNFQNFLKSLNVSLYTFVFDDEIRNDPHKDEKMKKIMHPLKRLTEGVLIFVDNFYNIKIAFQNISRSYKPKSIFRINSNIYSNIYLEYHKKRENNNNNIYC